jgi:transcriptional regulator with XRE-family HTH domain
MTTPSDVAAANVRRFRKDKGWTAQRLADECASLGAVDLSAAVIANIETGRRDNDGVRRRDVTVDELLALAVALNVSPSQFLAYIDMGSHPDPTYYVTPGVRAHPVEVRAWLHGEDPLPDDRDPDDFLRYEPRASRQRRRAFRHPAYAAVTELLTFVRDAIAGTEDVKPADMAKALRRSLNRTARHVELLAEEIAERTTTERDAR